MKVASATPGYGRSNVVLKDNRDHAINQAVAIDVFKTADLLGTAARLQELWPAWRPFLDAAGKIVDKYNRRGKGARSS